MAREDGTLYFGPCIEAQNDFAFFAKIETPLATNGKRRIAQRFALFAEPDVD